MTATISEAPITRETLEDIWRLRLEEAQAHYRKATDWYRLLLQGQSEGILQDADGDLALARRTKSEALEEYARVLRVFTELALHGKIPEERLEVGSLDL